MNQTRTVSTLGATVAARSLAPGTAEVVLYFERGLRVLRTDPLASWATVAVLLLAATWSMWSPSGRDRFLRQAVPTIVGIALIPIAIRYCYDRVSAWQASQPRFLRVTPGEYAAWWAVEHQLVTNHAVATLGGIVLVALASFAVGGLSRGLAGLEALGFCALVALAAFFAGVALYYVACFGIAIWRLGRFSVTVTNHPLGIRQVGALMTMCWSIAAGLWCLFTSTAMSHAGIAIRPVVVLGLPSAALLVASFVACQIPLHRRMREYKQRELEGIHNTLHPFLDRGVETFTSQDMRRVRFLEERLAAVAKLPEWPFDGRGLLRVASLSASFLLPVFAPTLAAKEPVKNALAMIKDVLGG